MVQPQTGCFFDAQTATVTSAGTRVQLSSSPEHIGSISVTAAADNAGDIYFGGDDVSSTVGKTLAPGQTIIVRAQEGKTFLLSDFYVDAANNDDKVEWVVGAIIVSTTTLPGTAISNLDIDGGTDIGAAIVDGDLFIIDDGANGTNRKTAASRIKTYIAALQNLVEDTSPQLGGDLDTNGSDITGVGHVGFLATQDASAGANDLDDYEEGSWTPTIQDNSLSDSESQTYSFQVGDYTKVGNRIAISGRVRATSMGSLTGTQRANMAGFPFTSKTISHMEWDMVPGPASGLAIAAGTHPCGMVGNNNAYIQINLYDQVVGTTFLTVTEFSDNGDMSFAGHYIDA